VGGDTEDAATTATAVGILQESLQYALRGTSCVSRTSKVLEK
jgi:hypothetical protein